MKNRLLSGVVGLGLLAASAFAPAVAQDPVVYPLRRPCFSMLLLLDAGSGGNPLQQRVDDACRHCTPAFTPQAGDPGNRRGVAER